MFNELHIEQSEEIKTNISQYQNGLIDLDELVDKLELVRVIGMKIRKDEREYNRIISTYTGA
jgi:hypothetical protein